MQFLSKASFISALSFLLNTCAARNIQNVDRLSEQISSSQITHLHNHFRRTVGSTLNMQVANMKKMYWNGELKRKAERWTSRCENMNAEYISEIYKSQKPKYGVLQDVSNKDVASILFDWFSQHRFFSRNLTSDGECDMLHPCPAFKQMVNWESDKVGCARNRCDKDGANVYFFACFYKNGIPDSTEPLFKEGRTCSSCDDVTPFCSKQLCVPADREEPSKSCEKTCNSNVGRGTLDPATCVCTCSRGLGANCDEPCKNKDAYIDYDVCTDIDVAYCRTEGNVELYREVCPASCGFCVPL